MNTHWSQVKIIHGPKKHAQQDQRTPLRPGPPVLLRIRCPCITRIHEAHTIRYSYLQDGVSHVSSHEGSYKYVMEEVTEEEECFFLLVDIEWKPKVVERKLKTALFLITLKIICSRNDLV